MFGSRSEYVVRVTIKAAELVDLFGAAAKRHKDKADIYRKKAESISEDEVEEDDDTELHAYASSVASNVTSAKKGLLDQARKHEQQAVKKLFIAKHLKPGLHELDASELESWGLV